MNLRLTCWRLCNTSSQLLLPFVHVELNQTSVDHLNTISQHPTISKGVRTVRVVLDYYDYELADDFMLFAEYSAATLGDLANTWEITISTEFGDQLGVDMESIQKARQLESLCNSFASGAVDDLTIGPIQTTESYFRECTRSTGHGQRTRSNFAQMETLLELREDDPENSHPWKITAPLRAGEDDYFLWWMLRRMTWDEGRHWVLGTPHTEILNDLPVAVHDGGIVLRSLFINITSLPQPYELLTAEEMKNLSMGVQHLKNIEIELRGHRLANDAELGYALDTTEWQYLRNYIDAVLNTNSIERHSLDLECFMSENTGPLTDLGSLMTFRSWGNLVEVRWRSVALYQKDMEHFFQQLRKPLKTLDLRSVHILSGSWAEILELLRTAPTGYDVTLSDPSGAECEDLGKEEYTKIFRTESGDYWANNQAKEYIIGDSRHNPLRADKNDQIDTSSIQQ
ncbi:MAG: hypothetical protein Q9221_000803 [Calogaya cf. arnoldii]